MLMSPNVATPPDRVCVVVPFNIAPPGLVLIAMVTLEELSLVQTLPYGSESATLIDGAMFVPAVILEPAIGCWVIVMLDGAAGTMLNELVVVVALPASMIRLYPASALVIWRPGNVTRPPV